MGHRAWSKKSDGVRLRAQGIIPTLPPFSKGGLGGFHHSITPNHNQKLWERLSSRDTTLLVMP